jgi:chemotaxis signal transduction protein
MRLAAADRKPAHHGEAVILFGVGDCKFAIAATAVEEIRSTQGMQQTGFAAATLVPKVKHRLSRDGRTYYVVDANLYFCLLPSPATRVLLLRNSRVALLVSDIDRMTEIGHVLALPHAFCGEERNWYRGLTVLEAGAGSTTVAPIVKPESILTAHELKLIEEEPGKRSKGAANA